MLGVEVLGRKFGDRWIFKGLSFEVSQGQCLAVLGKNGSGKSTLLKVIAGLLPASEGRVRCGPIGYFALDMAPYANLTAQEHLEFAGRIRGVEPEAKRWLDFVELAVRDVQAKKLSTGMRSRLKLALALQGSPDVLILDEAAAGLDEAGRALIKRVIELQSLSGATVLATNDPYERRLATHELELLD